MITRRRARVANSSESVDFEVNNQIGVVDTGEDTTPSEMNSVENPEKERARGPAHQPREMDFQLLMDFIRQQNEETRTQINEKLEKQEENNKQINEKLERQEENNKQINEKLEKQNEKLDKQKDEIKRQNE